MIILGAGEFAEIAESYLRRYTGYPIRGFAVEKEFLKEDSFCGLPVVPLEDIYKLDDNQTVVNAITQIPARIRLFRLLKERGFHFETFVHPRAYQDPSSAIGEGSFIFEDNVIQRNAVIGGNCVLWSGNHIGHRAVIGNHCFISSHVVVSGFCEIGSGSYVGVNACFADGVKIGENTLIGMGTVVHKDLEGGKVYVGNPARFLRENNLD